MMHLRQQGWAMASLAVAVLAGIAFMVMAGAPPRFAAMNGAGLVLALGIALIPPLPRRYVSVFALISIGTMVATVVVGPSVEGVRRWLQVGPFTIHAGMLVLPSLAVILPVLASRTAAIIVMAVSMLVVAQPDLATYLAILPVSILMLIARRDRWMWAAFIVQVLAAIVVVQRVDILAPIPFVEHVIEQAWAINVAAGGTLLLAAMATITSPLKARNNPNMLWSAAALASCGTAYLAASFLWPFEPCIGHYPTPFVGFGTSIILGWGIALWLLSSLGDKDQL